MLPRSQATTNRAKYAELKQALAAGWRVHDKYLSQRAREVGNVDWTTPLLEAVVGAVKMTQSHRGTPQFQKACKMLAAQHSSKATLGKLTVEQVKYGWGKMKDGGDERKSRKRGRPPILSAETKQAVMEYINEQLGEEYDFKLERILHERDELAAFNGASRPPYRYLRILVHETAGVPRATNDGGSKGVPKEERLECTALSRAIRKGSKACILPRRSARFASCRTRGSGQRTRP